MIEREVRIKRKIKIKIKPTLAGCLVGILRRLAREDYD